MHNSNIHFQNRYTNCA